MRHTIIDYPPLLERFGYVSTAICAAAIAIGIASLVSRRMVHSGAAVVMILATGILGLAEFARRLYQVSNWYKNGDAFSPFQLIGDLGEVHFALTGMMAGCGVGLFLAALSVVFTRDAAWPARKKLAEQVGRGDGDKPPI
ncbi:MAG: hypothetical protein J0M04_07045 [Verrucomicrobia bacterium]|nr:hypothetical protein [Verrucomicrobiota bacterium]